MTTLDDAGPYTQTFWVRDGPSGQSSRDYDQVHGRPVPPEGCAYFCPDCGEVWARVSIPGRPFAVFARLCERHCRGWLSNVGGSLWLDWHRDFNESIPMTLLMREFCLHLALWDARLSEAA